MIQIPLSVLNNHDFNQASVYIIEQGDISIGISKVHDNYVAFKPYCPHANYPLNNAIVTSSGTIICPKHNYRFNLKNGICTGAEDCRLKIYKSSQDEIFLNIYDHL